MKVLTIGLLLGPVLTAGLLGCATASPVMDAGEGTYFISARASPARGGTTGAHTVAFQDAQKFCAQKGDGFRPILIGTQERDVYQSSIGVGPYGGGGSTMASGSVNMRFKCER